MAGSPAIASLTASVAQTVTIDGVWPMLEVIPLASATQVVYARGDGTTAAAADGNYACPPFRSTRVPTVSTNGTSTSVSLFSGTAGTVQVRAALGGDHPDFA